MMSPGRDGFRICTLEAGRRTLALRLDLIREVVPMAALSRPPSMPAILEGILNLRGTGVPIVRLAALLGLPQDSLDLHTPLIVLRGNPVQMGLLVHRISGITAVAAGGLVTLPGAESFNGCVEGQVVADGMTVPLLAGARLLLEKETQALAEFREAAASRLQQVGARRQ